MASLTQWTWVWVDSGSWWWTRRPGVLQSMGSQDMTEELKWTEVLEETRVWAHGNDSLMCISAIWALCPMLSCPESPHGAPWGVCGDCWLGSRQPICLHPESTWAHRGGGDSGWGLHCSILCWYGMATFFIHNTKSKPKTIPSFKEKRKELRPGNAFKSSWTLKGNYLTAGAVWAE